jgi:hypothetical protein
LVGDWKYGARYERCRQFRYTFFWRDRQTDRQTIMTGEKKRRKKKRAHLLPL